MLDNTIIITHRTHIALKWLIVRRRNQVIQKMRGAHDSTAQTITELEIITEM
jgi:hypothetical protein